MRNLFVPFILILPSLAFAEGGHDHDHSAHGHGETGIYGHLHATVHADNVFDATEKDREITEIYSHSHLDLGAELGQGFSVNASLLLEGEPAGHAHGTQEAHSEPTGSDRFLDDHPLLVEQLTLNYEQGPFSLYAGKFNPTVGFYHGRFPGLYSYQPVEE